MITVVGCISILLRLMVGLWNYSGHNSPPLFGDFEAQRHWCEITTQIPISDWYRNTKDNDLNYWGLDYPPFTAYVSWIFGQIALIIYPPLVSLHDSRGHESSEGKLFMRLTVCACDCVVYIPAVIHLWDIIFTDQRITHPLSKILLVLNTLLLPGLLIIDHGHFQYNGVCIGLSLIGLFYMLTKQRNNIIASIFYCLSLNFKQMALYYAPVYFFSLLRQCFMKDQPLNQIKNHDRRSNPFLIVLFNTLKLGIVVLSTFTILWLPFCIFHGSDETCSTSLLHVLHRQFPFSRGIFEDKVSNLWYTLSVLVDIRTILTSTQLICSTLSVTVILILPTCLDLFIHPINPQRLLLGMTNCSLAFFLGSYQVHEKSILLSIVPASFLLHQDVTFICYYQIVGMFTMFPLLRRDGLVIPYICCNGIYLALVMLYGLHWKEMEIEHNQLKQVDSDNPTVREDSVHSQPAPSRIQDYPIGFNFMKNVWIGFSYFGMILLHVLESTLAPPTRYPDLYPALFSIYGAMNFTFIYLWMTAWQWQLLPYKKKQS